MQTVSLLSYASRFTVWERYVRRVLDRVFVTVRRGQNFAFTVIEIIMVRVKRKY